LTGLVHKEKGLLVLLFGVFILSIAATAFTEQYFFAAVPFALLLLFAGWQHRDILFYLLLLSLPFSFEYNFSPSFGTDIPDEFLMLLVAVVFFAYCLYSPSVITRNMISHPLLILLLVTLSWILVVTIFSTQPGVSVKYALAKTWYIGAFVLAPLVLFRSSRSIVIAAKVLAGSMFLVVLIILFRHYKDGFGFAAINDAVAPFFRNHVNYSAMLVCTIPLLAAFWAHASRNNKRWLTAAITIALVALFLSYARGAWLALLVGVAAFWLIRKKKLVLAYLFAVVLFIGTVFWLKTNDRYLNYAHDYKTTIYQKHFGKHLVSTYKLKDMSTAERFYRWIAGVRMIKDNWLTGYGPNTFYEHYKSYTIPAYKTWVSDNPERSTVHNYFLLTAIEQGLPALVFLIILLGLMLYYAQHLYHRAEDKLYKTIAAVTGVMVTMIIVLNFFSDLIETDKIGSLFFLCLSILVVIDINTRDKQLEPRFLRQRKLRHIGT
jgi:O-antigen ligase